MAVPPTVPTSFVPRPSSFGGPRRQVDLGGAFAFVGYLIFTITCLVALGIFLYGFYLDGRIEAKNEELLAAQEQIDDIGVQKLVALHNRLTLGKRLLDEHVILSGFFDFLEEITLHSVHFSALDVSFTERQVAKITLSGTARNFNALAAQSKVVGDDGRIKDAIFSNIKINQGSSVSFALSGTLQESLFRFNTEPAQDTPVTESSPESSETAPTP